MTCLCNRVPTGKRCVFCWYAAGAPGLPTAAERETEDRERRHRLATPGAYAVEDFWDGVYRGLRYGQKLAR